MYGIQLNVIYFSGYSTTLAEEDMSLFMQGINSANIFFFTLILYNQLLL